MANDYNIQIGVKADGSDLQKQVDRLAKGLKDIDIKVDSSSLKNVSVTYEEIEKTGKRIQTINAQLVNQNGQLLSATIKVDDATGDIINKKTKWTQSTKTETSELNKQTQQIQKQASLITQMGKADTKLKLFDIDYGNIEQFGSKIKSLQSELNSVQGIKNIDDQSSAFAKVNNEIQLLNKSLSIYKKNANLDGVTKKNQKLADSMDIVKLRAESASKSFGSYLQKLKPQALKQYSEEINNVSTSFDKAQKTGNKVDYSKATASLSDFKSQMKLAGMETSTFSQILKNNIFAFTNWYLIGGAVSSVVGNLKSAITTIKEVDTLLTEISKTSNLTGESLKELGINAFDAASKYGNTVQSYLEGYKEMSRGTDSTTAQGLAEMSILAQSAGDMTAELANEYIIATNAAYKLNGEVSKINAVLDSQNQISNRNQVSMSKIAEATKVAGSMSSQAGVEVNELSAAIGTMAVVTQGSGEEVGRAFKGILQNLQNVKGETDDGDILDEESFSKVEKAADDLGIKLKEVRDGVLSLRDPMQIIKELSEAYSGLAEGDVRGSNLITALGGKYRSNQLSALLSNYEIYEKILGDYEDANGSALSEANKTADSLEGRLNKLTNTWNRTMANIVDSNILKTFISIGTGAIDLVDKTNLLQTALIGLSTAFVLKGGTKLISILNEGVSSAMAFGNALNTVKADGFSNSWIDLGNAIKGLSLSQATAVLTTKNLSQATIEAALKQAGFSPQVAETTAATLAMASAEGVATGTTWSLSAAFTALGAAIKTNPIGAAITAVTTIVSLGSLAINSYNQSQEELISKSKEATTVFNDESSSIDSNISRIKELKSTLDASNSSIDEQSSAKEELLTIQNDLIESYNLEKSGLDLVNGSLDEQIEKLRTLNKEKAQDYLNENQQGIDKATREIERDDRHYNLSYEVVGYTDEGQAIKTIAEQFKDQGININESADGGTYYIHFNGDAQQAEQAINDFMTEVRELQSEYEGSSLLDEILSLSSSSLNEVQGVLDEFRNTYKSGLIADLITTTPSGGDLDPSKTYYEYIEAVDKYNEALSSGEGVDKAKKNLDTVKAAVGEVVGEFEKYTPLFTDVENQIATSVGNSVPKIAELGEEAEKSAQSVSTLSEAISAFQDTSDALDKVKSDLEEVGTISSDTINKLLGMENAEIESAIASYLTSGDANEILNTLSKIYETDLSNFKQVMLAKMETDESFWNTVMTNNAELVKGLAEKYNLDLSNWTSLAKAKASIETQLINNLASAWSKYYKTQVDANTGLLSVVDTSPNAGKDTYKGNSPYSDKFSKNTGFNAINEALSAKLTKEKNEAKSKVQAQVNAYNDAIKGLDNIAGISVDISADGLKDATAATKDLGSAAKDTKDELQELLDLFNDLEKGYDLRLNLFTDRDDKLQKSIDILEAQGNIVGEALYEELISSQEKQVKILQQKKTDFERFLSDSVSSGKLTVGTEEWFKMTQAIEDTKDEIMDATANVEKFQNAINDLHWEGFEQIIEHFEGLNSELDSIQSLLSRDDMVVDFTGDWTDEGITSLGLYGQAYELAQYQANKYAEEIEYLTNAYNQGLYSELEYQDKLRELNQAQWDSIDAANKAKDGIIELNEARIEAVKNGINKETEALEELINKKIELLDIEKDTHDFKKSVEEQETEISDLQRQLSALSTNDSAEAAAKRKLIQAELLEANKKLEETYYQESISQQKIALQKELDDFKTTQDEKIAKLDDSLDNQDALIKASLDTVLTNQRTVYNTLTQLGTQYGIQLSSAITDPWISGQNALSQYSGYFNEQMSGFKTALDGITGSYNALQSAADATANRIVGSLSQIEQGYVALKNAAESANSAMGSSSSGGGGGGSAQESKKQYYVVNRSGKAVSQGFDTRSEAEKWLSNRKMTNFSNINYSGYGVNKYAKGVKKVKEDQWAITNESDTGRELIYNPKEGFLTPLSKDTSVLKNDYTETIFDFLENPKGFMLGQLGLDKLNMPNIPASNNNGGSVSIGSLVTVNGNIDDNNFGKIQKVVKQEIQNSWKQFSTTSKRNRN